MPRPFSKDEQVQCIFRVQNGDTAARRELVERNLGLVRHFAKKYAPHWRNDLYDVDDLFNAGAIGLQVAVDRVAAGEYDSARGSFATFASWQIKSEMFALFGENKKREEYSFLPLDKSIEEDDGDGMQLHEKIGAEEAHSLDEIVVARVEGQELVAAVAPFLTERERVVLKHRFVNEAKLRYQELENMLDCSRGTIQQDEGVIRRKLRRVAQSRSGEKEWEYT